MIIKEVAFGNKLEAFIENRFKSKTNIVFSNDNNRGKTLLMQSIVYSIGYESIFPSGFNPKIYYFYSKIEFFENEIEFLRRGNSILIINKGKIIVFNSITEFKYYFDKEIYKLPKFDKDGEVKLADLSLLYELFFLGQDKRNTSNLIVRGLNNKVDFLNMLYSMMGISITLENKYDIENLRKAKADLESKIKSETRKIAILKVNPQIATFISSSSNNIDFKKTSIQLTEIHLNIAELKKKRNREENRKIKLEALVSELNSLNRSLSEGKVKCSECGSDKIIFSNEDFEFEVSNTFVRQNILKSIKENIILKTEIVEEFNNEIIKEQEQLNRVLEITTPETKNYILFQDEIFDSKEINNVILEFQNELDIIDRKIRNNETKIVSDRESQKQILLRILSEMKRHYLTIDPQGILIFEDLFTKSGETYSGSEGQEYYFCKLLALNNVVKHIFPILIDSFREGELSSGKEELMIQEFKKLNKQVILTSTLKKEEYDSDKYDKMEDINVIDYSNLQDSKILQASNVDGFMKLLERFGVKE
ncbi:MAG: hypothetical protein JWN56_1120 [Sphingobacteriales bacterium]|nr:hypothetical protein [Sphingobacteriales bacterium]